MADLMRASTQSAPPVVLDQLLEQVMGDREMLEMLVQLFLDDLPSRLRELEQAIGSGDPERVRRAAHPIKGACAQLGAAPARDVLNAIEEAGKRREMAEAEALSAAGYAELERLETALRQAVAMGARA